MTGFKTAETAEWLDFGQAVGLEIRSPLFDFGSIPGILSYPVSLADTPRNRRRLGFPAARSRQVGPVPVVEADYYIGGTLWRRGGLRYLGYDSQAREYRYQFEADADALATRLDGVTLPQLTLPTGQGLALGPETADYVLAPLRNTAFYNADKNPAWGGVVNYFAPGAPEAAVNPAGGAHRYAVAPLLKVVPLLRRVLGQFGYELTGPWVADAEIQTLVLYSTRALDVATGPEPAATFAYADLLPDVRVADLLLALQQTFCLGYVFPAGRREVHLVALRDVVADPAAQPRQPLAAYRDVASAVDGFVLGFTPDGDDALLKAAPWAEVRLGNGQESLKPAADTLRMVREADPLSPARRWLVPAAEQPGQSPREDFEQTDNRASHLRFLFYRGLQADSTGLLYPLASSGTVDYANRSVGNYALSWDGPKGLYQAWHKPWLDFRAAARVEERAVTLPLGEFLALDPTRKDLVAGLKFLWESVSVGAGGEGTLSDATITYHQIAQ
jgi:hypothetical protein